ncbi:hypothetical protein C5C36_10560 [Rathayibacter sp. AY1G1]|jgi:hypothetical protein|uniref:hypothetical protein n=1 Tax=unclassified Rathayibacter TaxID=2609250 RepID=UPI000CE7E683|nr:MULTISPECIES: hypothetical protein [unclassified Rathayibacter]PPF09730.1 hypothetical protein C5B98_14740 [Rathayibacter sp. AY1A5]PPF16172.1 hypothetical protein C5B92_12340 [Rathayibacter sp. AY1A4]PPF16676.1 hypothetical protein C5B95_15580 [Rathayibacter sp. AY1A7]PPF24530.1 hypothetical protein C5C54_16125 [Rathayibacter sp. AY1F2]PPF31605.1 hypothetical protein C5C10_14015 [Rathayibacter sp. AY1A3]
MSNPRYYDPVGKAVRALLVLSLVCFALAVGMFALDIVMPGTMTDERRPWAEASGALASFGVLALIVYFATVAIVGAIRGRGQ